MHIHTFNLLLIHSVCFYSLPFFHALPLRSLFFYYFLIYFSFSFFVNSLFSFLFYFPLFTNHLFTYLFVYLFIHLYHFFQSSCLSCFLPFFLLVSLRYLQLHIYMWFITLDLSIIHTVLVCGLCEPYFYHPCSNV